MVVDDTVVTSASTSTSVHVDVVIVLALTLVLSVWRYTLPTPWVTTLHDPLIGCQPVAVPLSKL
ncbi:hypothetical protein D3C84_1185980 [compost metagenome]